MATTAVRTRPAHYAAKNLTAAYKTATIIEFEEIVTMFMRSRKNGVGTATRPNRPRSLDNYSFDLNRFFTWLKDKGIHHYSGIQRKHVADYVDYYQSRQLSQSSKNHMFRTLRALFNFTVKDEDCRTMELQNFTGLLPRISKNDRRVYLPSPEVVNEFLNHFDQEIMWGLRDYVVSSLIIDCGLRIGEVCELTPACIKYDSSHMLVPDGKTGQRIVPLTADRTLPLLKRWLRVREKFAKCDSLFITKAGGKCRPTTFDQSFEEIRERNNIGISPEGCLTPHTLRHFFCTHYLINGGGLETLQQISGHTELSTLMLYVHMAAQLKTVSEEHSRVSPLKSLQEAGKKKRKMY